MENEFDLDLFDLIALLPCLQIPSKSSLENRKCRFDFVSFTIAIRTEIGNYLLPILSRLDLLLPCSDRYHQISTNLFSNLAMKVFRIISLIHDVALGSSGLSKQSFRTGDVMYRFQ
ncbi:hypothetical protein ABH15_06845 [Methanoculleus taiwanensis]|uniref:Uncharacterized protein n=1 Tax=Methanoculleus taiwanensis TaxID=1550565 RepID=A0A498GZ33_9EURY|nr:hypothetical protein ABH15_06845 [Methanoculleus taiwanensis]